MKPVSQLFWIVSMLFLVPAIALRGDTANSLTQPFQLAQRHPRLSWRVRVRSSRYRVGGLSRGNCPNRPETAAIAFVPPPRPEERIEQKRSAAVDITLSDRPAFWVYVKSLPAKTPVQFTLQTVDQHELTGYREVYNTRLEAKGGTGLLGVRIPKTVPALNVGESYSWKMAIVCDLNKRDADVVIESWVQRLLPEQIQPTTDFDPKPLVQKLARASDRDKPTLYAGLGVWQDAVTTLIDLQQKQPQNRELAEDWRNLLVGAQLGDYVSAPVLEMK